MTAGGLAVMAAVLSGLAVVMVMAGRVEPRRRVVHGLTWVTAVRCRQARQKQGEGERDHSCQREEQPGRYLGVAQGIPPKSVD
jgi:hypothetical protein